MLVLSRKVGEKIRIDGNIEVTIVKIRGDRIQVGIAAPRDVTVHREEVADRIERETVPTLRGKPRWTRRDLHPIR